MSHDLFLSFTHEFCYRAIIFFVFADIITGVSGILIFVTLLLATGLDRAVTSDSASPDPGAEQQVRAILQEELQTDAESRRLQGLLVAAETAPAIDQLEDQVAQLRSQLSQARTEASRGRRQGRRQSGGNHLAGHHSRP